MPKAAGSSSTAKLTALLLIASVGVVALVLRRAAPPVTPAALSAPSSAQPASSKVSMAAVEPQAEEQRLFRAAEAALAAGDTDAAFSLLYEQATKFPKGALAGAREVTHAKTLCLAGKRVEARAEAAAFIAAHADSPLTQAARLVCAP